MMDGVRGGRSRLSCQRHRRISTRPPASGSGRWYVTRALAARPTESDRPAPRRTTTTRYESVTEDGWRFASRELAIHYAGPTRPVRTRSTTGGTEPEPISPERRPRWRHTSPRFGNRSPTPFPTTPQWSKVSAASAGATTTTARRASPRRFLDAGPDRRLEGRHVHVQLPRVLPRPSTPRSRCGASRSTSTTATSTTSSGICSTTPTPRRWCSTPASATGSSASVIASPSVKLLRAGRRRRRTHSTASTTTKACSWQRTSRPLAVERIRDRHLHALHRRHHWHAEGRDVRDGSLLCDLPRLDADAARSRRDRGAGRPGRRRKAKADRRRRHRRRSRCRGRH